MEKLPIAPARSVPIAAESLSEPGGTMVGMLTRSGSLQASLGSASATARSASSLGVCFMELIFRLQQPSVTSAVAPAIAGVARQRERDRQEREQLGCMLHGVDPRALEGHVDARQEVAHRGLTQEVRHAEVELA